LKPVNFGRRACLYGFEWPPSHSSERVGSDILIRWPSEGPALTQHLAPVLRSAPGLFCQR